MDGGATGSLSIQTAQGEWLGENSASPGEERRKKNTTDKDIRNSCFLKCANPLIQSPGIWTFAPGRSLDNVKRQTQNTLRTSRSSETPSSSAEQRARPALVPLLLLLPALTSGPLPEPFSLLPSHRLRASCPHAAAPPQRAFPDTRKSPPLPIFHTPLYHAHLIFIPPPQHLSPSNIRCSSDSGLPCP